MIEIALAFGLLVTQSQVVLVRVDQNDWHIQYPPTINPTNYFWTIQFSTNLQTMPFEFLTQTSYDTNGDLYFKREYSTEYFRLVGIPLDPSEL